MESIRKIRKNWPIIIFILGVLITAVQFNVTVARNSEDIEKIKIENTALIQKSATFEEAITTMKADNMEIKRDIKSILQILK